MVIKFKGKVRYLKDASPTEFPPLSYFLSPAYALPHGLETCLKNMKKCYMLIEALAFGDGQTSG